MLWGVLATPFLLGLGKRVFVLVYSGLKLLRHLDSPRDFLANRAHDTTSPGSRAHLTSRHF